MSWSRRRFLSLGLSVPAVAAFTAHRARAQGLDAFGTPAVPCTDAKPTPAAPDEKTFKAGSPARAAIAAGVPGQKLVLTGTVSGVICGPIKGAIVDFWQADAKGVFDTAGFNLRGRQLTDAKGVYRLETIVPGVPTGAAGRAPHISVRVQPPGKPALATQVFLADHAGNARDPQFKPELAMKVTTKTPDLVSASFNFVINA